MTAAALSAAELRAAYRTRALSPVEVVDELAARIAELNGSLVAFTALCVDRAREEALAAERAFRAGGDERPLLGVPFGVKDLFDTEGVRTAYGSPIFADQVPAVDATAVRRAREAGAILLGKTQTHEFAWGITSVNELTGTSRNPWAPDRISGGSSGGSAVALAAQLVPLALGSDTGGSIRVPAALCGTVGLKPTFGRVSAAGVMPLARSLDHPGPMARTPTDAALLLAAIAGVDAGDAATADVPLGDAAELERGVGGLRVGLCEDLHLVPLTPEAARALDDTVAVLRGLGAEIVEVAMPEATVAHPTFVTTQRAEALHTHVERGLYPVNAASYGEDVRARLEAATHLTVRDYLAAAAERQRLRAAFARVFADVDLLLTPVAAGPAPLIAEVGEEFRDLVMPYTVPQDLTGLPACAVRAGFDTLGLPIGVQLTGPAWCELRVLGAAQALWAATPDVQDVWPDTSARPTEAHARL